MKNTIKSISVILFYFISVVAQGSIYDIFNIKANLWTALIYQLIIILIIIYIYRLELKDSLIEFKNNKYQYLKPSLKYLALSFGLVALSNAIIMGTTGLGAARNQEGVIEMTNSIPLASIILVVLAAPILEELVFRLSIKKLCGNIDILFILLSGLIFGSLHVIGLEIETWQEYLFIISYSIPGFIFAYTLIKYKNIFVPIWLHFINNLIGICAILLLMILQ